MGKEIIGRVLYWLPRGLTIIFALFLSLFALDSFVEGTSFLYQLIGFLIHLMPVYILVIFLLIAWRWELIGGVLFFAVGIFFTIFFNTYEHLMSLLFISSPVFIIGALFILSKYHGIKKQKKHGKKE